MNDIIKTTFDKELKIEITNKNAEEFILSVYQYEIKKDHALVLNSPYLGIHKIYFLSEDVHKLFNIFNVDFQYFNKLIKGIPSINKEFIVSSDSYNILITYLLHKTFHSNLNSVLKNKLSFNLIKMLHYKYFTSLVNYNFKHGAKEEIMKAVINNLNQKFDIVIYGTWKKVLEVRCEELTNTKHIHYNTIKNYNDDSKILYFITDTQTRLRNKLKIIIQLYYDAKERGDSIGSYSLVSELNEEKIINNVVNNLDVILNNITNDILISNKFINSEYVKIIMSLFHVLKPDLFRYVLNSFTNLAVLQIKEGIFHLVEENEKTKSKTYIGVAALLKAIIQTTYRACLLEKINMKSKVAILEKTKNMYSASRINDKDILDIKNSVSIIIDKTTKSNREVTKTSLKIAFIIYIMLKSFDYLK